MQTHGVPNFPVPTSTGQSFQVSGNPGGGTPNTPSGRAYANCKGLLPQSSTSTGSGVTQAELDQTLKIVQCLRAHGEPDIPDPTVVNGNLNIAASPSVVQSSQFQAAATACRSLLPKGVHLP
jgi:hypothetical protein